MEYSARMDSLNRIFTWFSNLAYLNFLWMLSSLMGLLVLGVAPATSALFAVIRQLLRGEEQVSITKSFFSYYRKDFWKVNGIFYVLVLVGTILLADLHFLFQMNTSLTAVLFLFLMVVSVFYLMICLFIFPVFVHYKLSFFNYFKQAFFLSVTKPLYSIIITVSLVLAYLLLIFLKTLFFFFFASLGAFIMMASCHQLFSRLGEQMRKKSM